MKVPYLPYLNPYSSAILQDITLVLQTIFDTMTLTNILRKEVFIMTNEKLTFEERIKNIPIINRNPSPEEELELQKQWEDSLLTDEEEEQLSKELIEDIQNGNVPGYIDENGNPHTAR